MYTMLQILFTKVGIFAQHVCTRMSRVVERSVNVARMSRECRTIVARLSHDCRTNVARMSHERRTNVACRRTWQHCLRTATWRIDQAWRSILGLNTCERGTLKKFIHFCFPLQLDENRLGNQKAFRIGTISIGNSFRQFKQQFNKISWLTTFEFCL
jgi:hypothetical protein